ncbi:MAG: hypothetical protein HY401_04480 [Elusimicrobia bacterium]|nr:hypothetical protein [Elusimicrobiota bacterium]
MLTTGGAKLGGGTIGTGATGAKSNPPSWANTLGITALFAAGLIGIYLNPLLEVTTVAYIAVAASTVWVFMDAPRWNLSRWPWTAGTLALWAFIFPVYLWKTRRWTGLVPGLAGSLIIVGMQAFPHFYSEKKHFRRGVLFAGQQRFTQAENEFKMAIKKNPALGEAHLNLGILYMSQGMLEASERELTAAQQLLQTKKPKYLGDLNQNEALSLCSSHLAAVYAMRTSEEIQVLNRQQAKIYFAKAKEYASRALELDGGNLRSQELTRRLKQLETFLE